MTTTSGPAWWASAFGTIIEGAGAVRVPAGCYDLCTLFKADSVTVLVLYCISSYCEFLSHWFAPFAPFPVVVAPVLVAAARAVADPGP